MKKKFLSAAGALALAASSATAAVPSDISTAITDATTVMESLQTLVIVGVAFGIIISIVKKRGKA